MRRSPVPAYLIAVLALVVALGGGAYAATKLPKNSVGTKQLKSNAVTTAKVADGSLTAADFAKNQLPPGPPGPAGPPGPKGADGQAVTAFRTLTAATGSLTFVDVLAVPGVGTAAAGCQQVVGAGQPVILALRYTVGADGQRVLVESDGTLEPGDHVLDAGVSTGVTYNQATSETGRLLRAHVSGTRAGGVPYAATLTISGLAKEEGENRCSVAVVVTGG